MAVGDRYRSHVLSSWRIRTDHPNLTLPRRSLGSLAGFIFSRWARDRRTALTLPSLRVRHWFAPAAPAPKVSCARPRPTCPDLATLAPLMAPHRRPSY